MRTKFRIIGLLLVLAALALQFPINRNPVLPAPQELERPELALHNGRLCRTGETFPFSGFLVERYADGAMKSRSAISHGLLNGPSEGWSTNGVLQIREHFKDGVSHGFREKWHDNA